MDMDELGIVVLGFLGVVLTIVGLVISIIAIDNAFFDNIPTKATVNGVVVYSGPSCGLVVSSSGYSTTLRVKKGFLYLFSDKYYVDKNIVVEGAK